MFSTAELSARVLTAARSSALRAQQGPFPMLSLQPGSILARRLWPRTLWLRSPCCDGSPIESHIAPEPQAWNRPGCSPPGCTRGRAQREGMGAENSNCLREQRPAEPQQAQRNLINCGSGRESLSVGNLGYLFPAGQYSPESGWIRAGELIDDGIAASYGTRFPHCAIRRKSVGRSNIAFGACVCITKA